MDMSRAQEKQKSGSYFRQRGHTPFCSDTCNLEHHELVTALCLDGRHVSARIQYHGVLPAALTGAIECLKLQGWDINSEIPDPLEELRCPLLYLACAFGKIGIVEGLLQHNFNPCVVTRHGETALHGTVRHLYNTGSFVRPRKSAQHGKNLSTSTNRREEAFFSILSLLSEYYPRILAFKDNSGFTALHLAALKITRRNCNDYNHGFSKSNKRSPFHEYCLKIMIKRLFELEAVSLLTKQEVMETLTTSDNGYEESLLHILARDRKGGFGVLKFVRDLLLSLGIEMPNVKNRRNETVFSIASQTNARDAAEMFPDLLQQQRPAYQDTSTAKYSEILRGTEARELNIDNGMPQLYHNFENDTGYPFAEFSGTSSEPEIDHVESRDVFMQTPKITHTFSLACEAAFEVCTHPSSPQPSKREDTETASTASDDEEIVETWASDSRADWNQQHTDATSQSGCSENVETSSRSSSEVEIVESGEVDECSRSHLNQLPWLQGDGANDIESDNSFLEFVLTEGISLDTLGKRDIVSVVLGKHKEKLRQLEESLPQMEQTLIQSETSIVQKTARLNSLQKEVDSLKKEIAEKNKSRNELRRKIELVNEEKNILKRRVEHCEETQNLLTSPSKKARL